jgi:hypothetical protein
VCRFRPQRPIQIVIVASVEVQEQEAVARGPRGDAKSERLFSLMREGLIKSLMRIFKKHQATKKTRD